MADLMTKPNPDDDHRARLRCAARAGGNPEELAKLLDILALWPGQEDKRKTSLYVRDFNNSTSQRRVQF